MTLKKKFLQPQIMFLEISRFRLVVGIVLGMAYSFAFYSFLYVCREVFRVLSVDFYNDMFVLSDSEVNFYNLFFALISVIFGQSVCFNFWFDKPRAFQDRFNRRRLSIVNDQRVLNWYFLDWFAKMGVAFGIMFVLTLHGGQYVFSFYPKYNYIFVLIVIVLFFQTWNTLRWTFLRRSLKWFLLSIAILSVVSVGLSRVNLIDYKAINDNYLKNNIQFSYQLMLPESDIYSRVERRSLVMNLFIVQDTTLYKAPEPIIIIENQVVGLKGMCEKIEKFQESLHEYDRSIFTVLIFIHRDIKMGFVNQLKNELSNCGVSRIAYAVVPTQPLYDQRFYQDIGMYFRLQHNKNENSQASFVPGKLDEKQNIIEVRQLEMEYCLVVDSLVDNENVKEVMQKLILKNPDYVIKFYLNDQVIFSSYLKVLTACRIALNELRDYYAHNRYSKKYDELFISEIDEVNMHYSYRLIEFTTEREMDLKSTH